MLIRKATVSAFAAFLISLAGCGGREPQQPQQQAEAAGAQATNDLRPVRVSVENTDAAEPALATARDGTAYIAWVEHRENKEADVMFAHLDNAGKMTGSIVRVNPNAGEATAWRGDPPTVAVAPDGTVCVGWTARPRAEGHGNDLYLSATRDGGKTFEPPVKVNDDGKQVAHGMHSLAIGADNRIYLAWLDERNVVKPAATSSHGAMQKMEQMEANREVFFASSADGGRTFSPNQLLAKDACPCCKTAITADAQGRVFVSWRQVLPGEYRHIALTASEDGGKTFRAPLIVSDDRWMIAACPVSGPALSLTADNALRVVWYTEGEKNGPPGLYWAESHDGGRTFSESKTFAKGEAHGSPVLLAGGSRSATVIWESTEGGTARVMSAPLAGAASAKAVAGGGELPSAAASQDQLFIGYIAKIDNRRSIWVVRAKPAA